MRILVAYATRHGATEGIAERVARTLEGNGLSVDLKRIDDVEDVEKYDAFVIGSAAYFFHWLREASSFVRVNARLLAQHPVWLFSSGPLGTARKDAAGHNIAKSAQPREFTELTPAILPRDQHVFFGAFDPAADPVGLMDRSTRLLPAVRDALPNGDFRDWDEIERWAIGIAHELKAVGSPVPA